MLLARNILATDAGTRFIWVANAYNGNNGAADNHDNIYGRGALAPRGFLLPIYDSVPRLDAVVEGKEVGRDELVNKMMELYAPDVIAEVPPHDEDQIGPVLLRGSPSVKKWVDKISRTQVKLLYIQRRQTKKQFEGEKMVYSTPLPWGGVGISFEIIGAWSRREDRRKFTAPGAVFLQYGADGEIERLRLYLAETAEVVAL